MNVWIVSVPFASVLSREDIEMSERGRKDKGGGWSVRGSGTCPFAERAYVSPLDPLNKAIALTVRSGKIRQQRAYQPHSIASEEKSNQEIKGKNKEINIALIII